ncbi:MAG: hypothetical protein IT361_11245 [Gemmatimonadaceae bacterium]|nr:hypothetical protein [Gemmatimonadaceae bacterium]
MSRIARGLTFALVLTGSACGGGDDGSSPPPIPQGFSVTLSATALSVPQGASGGITATIARTGNFTGVVNLSLESVPTGVAASFNPATITAATATTGLTVTVGSTVAPGNYTFTIRARANGLADQTAAVSLTVTQPPSIRLINNPATATVIAGGNTAFTATVSRTNFAGAVTLAVTGTPDGVTTTVAQSGDVFTVTVGVSAATAAGDYVLAATASGGSSVTAVSAGFTLTVIRPQRSSIALSTSNPAVTVQPGGTPQGSVVTIARTNFTGAVTFAATTGLPSGLTAAFTPATPTTGNSVVVNFTAATGTASGTYNVVVQGTGQGIAPASVQFAVTVAGSSGGSIAIAAVPSAVSVAQGSSGGTTINVVRTGITGPVTLTTSNVPGGVIATFGAPVTTQNSSSLTFAVGASVPVGSYEITVTGAATGVANVSTTVTLTVTPGQVGTGNVTFTFCGESASIPVWVAYQNAFGAWQQATAVATNTYSFTISTIGGVAWVTPGSAGSWVLSIAYGTFVDLQARGQATCTAPTSKTVTGTVGGLTAASDAVLLSVGGATPATPPTQASPTFTITGVPPGTVDLAAARFTVDLAGPTPLVLQRLLLRRAFVPANNASLGTIDFSGSEGFDPETRQLQIVGVGVGEQGVAATTFLTANGAALSLGTAIGVSTVAYSAVPSSRTMAGDLHTVTATATTTSGSLVTVARSITAMARDATSTQLVLPSTPGPMTVSTASTVGHARLRAVYSRQGEYDNVWSARFVQAARATAISMTSGYMALNGAFDVTIPDFASVNGWQDSWGLQVGASTTWQVAATGWVVGNGMNAEGAVTKTAYRQGRLTP